MVLLLLSGSMEYMYTEMVAEYVSSEWLSFDELQN